VTQFGYDDEEGVLTLQVAWDPGTVELIKTLPELAWIKKKQRWEIPVTRVSVQHVLRVFGAQTRLPPAVRQRIAGWERLRQLEDRSRATNELRLRDHTPTYLPAFEPKVKSFAQQVVAFNEAHDRDFYGLFMEMGTGKTKIAIDLLDYWYETAAVRFALVVCPNTVKGSWQHEVEIFSRHGRAVRINSGATGQRVLTKLIQQGRTLYPPSQVLPILVVNYEALRTKLGPLLATLLRRDPSAMILDESCNIKNIDARQSEAALALGTLARKRLIMDGTPVGNNPLDLFSQCKFLSRDVLGYENFYAFRGYYAQMGGDYGRVPYRWKNLDVLRKRVAGHAYRVLKKDCVDLPEKLYEVRSVPMGKEQDRVYRKLRDELLVEMEGVGRLSITNSFSMLTKLTQVAGGFVNLGTGDEPHWTAIVPPEQNQKLQELLRIVLENVAQRPVIFCTFNREIEILQRELRKAGIKSATIRGAVKPRVRDARIAAFQRGRYDCLLMQVRVGSIGITVTASSLAIYYSNTFNMRLRLQSEDRLHRIGQKRNVTYVDLLSTLGSGAQTVEHRIWSRLTEKKGLADLVTGDAFKKFIA